MELLLRIAQGIPMTVAVFAGSLALGVVGAVPLALAKASPWLPLRLLARLVIDLLRGVPAVVWLFILYFGISIGAFQFDEYSAAVLGLGVVSAAYLAEIYRGGVSSIHRGQIEAARALGLSPATTFVHVIGPQAFRVALPGGAAYAIALVKDTSLASTIGVIDITYLTRSAARDGAGLEVFLLAAAIYIALSAIVGLLARRVERTLKAKVSR